LVKAEIAGTGRRFAVGIGEETARRLADVGVKPRSPARASRSWPSRAPSTGRTVSESQDLTAEREGVAATFGTDAAATQAVQRRKDERQAALSGASQQAGATQQGLSGLGSASSY
jgi:hypothetical protein